MVSLQRCALTFAVSISCAAAFPQAGELRPASMFTDHMVLQRGVPLKVWGTAKPGANINVKLNEASASGKSDDQGSWLVTLPEQKAGGPFELTIAADGETTTINDVLVGEVWVCSGQSNMEWHLSRTDNAKKIIANAANNQIRLFHVPRSKAIKPLKEFELTTEWEVCSPETVGDFSAVGYYFGRELQEELDVPIGLIESAWGGTKAEWWMPLEGLKKLPFLADEAREMSDPVPDEKLTSDYRKAAYGWKKSVMNRDPGTKGGKDLWAQPDFSDSDWKTMKLPGKIDEYGMGDFDGSIWYRRSFEVTPEQAGKVATLSFYADDQDFTFVNGESVGATDSPSKLRQYTLPTALLKPGKNMIAIQVWDWGKSGGVWGEPESLSVAFKDGDSSDSIALAGSWNYSTGVSLADTPGRPKAPQSTRPTVLYNAMISPMVNYAIRGAIWYQGEANARSETASVYDETMATLISEWRKAWDIGDFPFFQVQLASYMKIEDQPGESDWAVLREAQEDVLELVPNTAFATAIDVGDEKNIHPGDKKTVGERLALNALAVAYDKPIEFMGPIYKSHEIKGEKVIISFSHADGLKTRNGAALKGFSIAGADGRYVWGDAEIKDGTVVVTSEQVKQPVAVRYGWANFVTGNLYNESDLPASPFRTDKPQ